MNKAKQPEFWQRGPVAGITPLLQPAAHAILQAYEEVEEELKDFPGTLLWETPAAVASVGFHLQHMTGVLDRLFTYANKSPLSTEQLLFLEKEGKVNTALRVEDLLLQFNRQVEKAIEQLRHTPETTLLDPRGIGRKQIPTNVLGLLFHAAEHLQRHTGQLIVTVRVLRTAAITRN